jgi:hypothetical protein
MRALLLVLLQEGNLLEAHVERTARLFYPESQY